MPRYKLVICPIKTQDNSVNYENGKSITVSEQEDGTVKVIVPVCPVGSICHTGQYTRIKICPTGEVCGCNYDVDITWLGYNEDRVLVKWDNPDKCILERIELKAKTVWGQSWNTIMKYIHTKSGDPNVMVYPEGDDRNDRYCHGCGIGGDGKHPPGTEEFWDTGKIIPGMMYRVDGYFRNDSCGGVNQPVVLGYALYETPALTSGEIVSVVLNPLTGRPADPPQYVVKLFDNDIDYYPLTINHPFYSVDYYPWEVGDSVMIMKDKTSYPGGDAAYDDPYDAPGSPFAKVRYTSGNSQERNFDSMIISAYEVLEGFYE